MLEMTGCVEHLLWARTCVDSGDTVCAGVCVYGCECRAMAVRNTRKKEMCNVRWQLEKVEQGERRHGGWLGGRNSLPVDRMMSAPAMRTAWGPAFCKGARTAATVLRWE